MIFYSPKPLSILQCPLKIATLILRRQPQICCAMDVSSYTHILMFTYTTHNNMQLHTQKKGVIHNLNVNICLTEFFDFSNIFLSLRDDYCNKDGMKSVVADKHPIALSQILNTLKIWSATNPPSEIVTTIYCCDIYIYIYIYTYSVSQK